MLHGIWEKEPIVNIQFENELHFNMHFFAKLTALIFFNSTHPIDSKSEDAPPVPVVVRAYTKQRHRENLMLSEEEPTNPESTY